MTLPSIILLLGMFPLTANSADVSPATIDIPAIVSNWTQEEGRLPVASPRRPEAIRTYRAPITAYSSTPDQTDSTPFITASGTHVRDGVLAANFLPIGTKVRMPELYGDKIFVVEDRMNARYNVRADIWMETREEAKQFGLKRNVLVEVLPKWANPRL